MPLNPVVSKTDIVSRREALMALEAVMLDMVDEQVEIETHHDFLPGCYARTIFIPAGVTVMGKIHRTRHFNVLSSGIISVATEEGVVTLEGPYEFWAEPGTKRVGYAHTDVVWTTFHETDETDLVKLEGLLIAPSFEALEGPEEQACLG